MGPRKWEQKTYINLSFVLYQFVQVGPMDHDPLIQIVEMVGSTLIVNYSTPLYVMESL